MTDNLQPWQETEHTADLALRVRGEDLPALFRHAALGMLSLLGGRIQPGQSAFRQSFRLQAPDWETLLVDWLNELLYLIEEKKVFFSDIVVHRVSDLTLDAPQLGFFEMPVERRERLSRTLDSIRAKHGFGAIQRGRTMPLRGLYPADRNGYVLKTSCLSR